MQYDSQIEEYKKKIFGQEHEIQKLREQNKWLQHEKDSIQKRNLELSSSIEKVKSDFEKEKVSMQERYEDFEEHHRSYMKKSEANIAVLEKQLKNSKVSDSSLLQRNPRHGDVLPIFVPYINHHPCRLTEAMLKLIQEMKRLILIMNQKKKSVS